MTFARPQHHAVLAKGHRLAVAVDGEMADGEHGHGSRASAPERHTATVEHARPEFARHAMSSTSRCPRPLGETHSRPESSWALQQLRQTARAKARRSVRCGTARTRPGA